MADILLMTLKCIFLKENFFFVILIIISVNFIPEVPIDNKSTSVQVMAWCLIITKPLPEPIFTKFCDRAMSYPFTLYIKSILPKGP